MPLPRPISAVIVILVLTLGSSLVGAEWQMEGSNAAHTGEQETLSGVSEGWRYTASAELMTPPSTAYGEVYFGTSDGWLVVLDEAGGAEEWTIELGGSITATPLVESRTIFVPSGNTLYAIASSNRSVKWSFEAVGDLRGSPILESNTIYTGSEDKHLYAIDMHTGVEEWSIKLDDVIATSPSISGLTIVVGTESGTLYGVHRLEGTELWSTDLGSPVSTSACINRETAMVGTFGGRLYAVDTTEGNRLWDYPAKGEPALDPILSTPATSSGLVYFGSDGLYCLDVRNGELVWYERTNDFVRGSPAIVGDYVVFGSYDGIIRCLGKNLGNNIWRYDTGVVIRSGVSIDYDKAYVGGRNGILYARSILNHGVPEITGPYTIEAEAHDSILFEIEARDPEGNMITFNWDFGDGNTSHEESPLHEYESDGDYTVVVTVSDGTKSSRHEILVVVHPFEIKVEGGDEEGLSTMTVAIASVATFGIVLIVLLAVMMARRRSAAHELSRGVGFEGATSEVTDDGGPARPLPPPPPPEYQDPEAGQPPQGEEDWS